MRQSVSGCYCLHVSWHFGETVKFSDRLSRFIAWMAWRKRPATDRAGRPRGLLTGIEGASSRAGAADHPARHAGPRYVALAVRPAMATGSPSRGRCKPARRWRVEHERWRPPDRRRWGNGSAECQPADEGRSPPVAKAARAVNRTEAEARVKAAAEPRVESETTTSAAPLSMGRSGEEHSRKGQHNDRTDRRDRVR